MPWERHGDCPPERCQGQCCNHMGFWVEDPNMAHWAEVRGVRVADFGDRWLIDSDQRCQFLTDDNLCSLHPDMNPSQNLPARPLICSNGPEEPSQMLLDTNCGFTFTEVDEPIGVNQ